MIRRTVARWLLPCLMLLIILPANAGAGMLLRGKVMLVGTQDELTPAEGVMVMLEGTGDSKRTKAGGLFNLPLPDAYRAGERITLQVDKAGWRIQYPLDGQLRLPGADERQRISIRLLPLGSKKWWSDDRIEKFIIDTAARAKEQIGPEPERRTPDFARYIKDWAVQYGFSADEAQAEIERWVSEVQQQDDLHKLGLAAFAEKHFGKAERLFRQSAAVNARRMRASEQRIQAERQRFEDYREATIRDYRLAGDAAYSDYAFAKALDAYKTALELTDPDQHPRQWAEVTMDVAKASSQIGIRTEGPAVKERLAEAVAAFRAALQVYTRELLPQQWATTQNNLGIALQEQGTRTGGEDGRRLLAEALDAFRGALGIYQAVEAGHHVQIVERNIALTELFLSAETEPDAQFTLGVLHVRGQAVEQDDAKAVQWLRRSAVQGHAAAQLRLGLMIIEGRGMDQDDASGYAWVHLAAETGLEDALEQRDQLQKALDQSTVQEAERLSRSLLPVEGEKTPALRTKETRPQGELQ